VKRALVAASVLALLGIGGAAAYVLYERAQGADVRGSRTVEFVPTETAPVPPPPPPPPKEPGLTTPELVSWGTYGFDAQRLRFDPGSRLHPPFRRIWTFHGGALLEFPPAVAYGRLFLPTFDGRFYAIDPATGKPVWRFGSGKCSWASPAVGAGLVYETFLDSSDCGVHRGHPVGWVVAFDARTGRVRWLRRTGPTESSPLLAGGRVYVGDWDGDILALDARTGSVRWSYRADGPVKGSLALDGGRVYVGSYGGHVYALDARTGRFAWRSSGQERLGSSGRFYSTPALAYGRVYIGSTDDKVYSFGAETGKLRWSHSTGGYVYASPAVWRQLVLVGSYDGSFYAFDAATGDLRWRFRANGPISGSATVLDGIVYFSTLRERTYGLDARTGRRVWSFPDGKYSPVVADDRRVYLVGLGRMYGLVPAPRAHQRRSRRTSGISRAVRAR
jgi:outer membrane protein assembly factor BamB